MSSPSVAPDSLAPPVASPRPLSLWKRLLFAALPTVFLLVVAESALRLTGAADVCPTYKDSLVWTCDPILYFRARAGLAGGVNAQGFRAPELTSKEPGVYRILAMGDSCTFGVTAREDRYFVDEPYPKRLQSIIDERVGPDKIEVLNIGVPGYNTYQGLMLLRTKLRGLQPDLITIRYGWNDHLMSPEGKIGDAFREPANPWLLAMEDLLLRTKLYPFSRRLGMELKLPFQEDVPKGMAALPREWKPNVPLQQYEHNLRRMVDLARAQGAEVWLLTSPSAFLTPDLLASYEALPRDATARVLLNLDRIPSFKRMMEIHDAYNAATRAVAAEMGVRLIDMAEIYRTHPPTRFFSMQDVLHPAQAGHNLEAEVLYEQLKSEGIIRPARPGAGSARRPTPSRPAVSSPDRRRPSLS